MDMARVPSDGSTAAVRALWTCIQETAGERDYYVVDLTGRDIPQGLSDVCRGQTRELNEQMGATFISFRSFLVVLITSIPIRLQYCCFLNNFIEI